MVSGKKDIIAQRGPNPASPGPIQARSPVCLMKVLLLVCCRDHGPLGTLPQGHYTRKATTEHHPASNHTGEPKETCSTSPVFGEAV